MAANDVLKNINLQVDGRGYAGKVGKFTPPKLTLLTEDYRAGGMDMAIKIGMGMDTLDCSFTLKGYDKAVMALFGLRQGNNVPLTLLKGLEDLDGTVTQVKYNLRGKIIEIDEGDAEPGQLPELTIQFSPTYYKMTHGGTVVHEIDAERMIRVINGTDQLAAMRAALML